MWWKKGEGAFSKALGNPSCGSQPHRSTDQRHSNHLRILPVKLTDWLCGWHREAGPPRPGWSALSVVWKNSYSASKVGVGDLVSFLTFIFPDTALHNMENQEMDVRVLMQCHLLEESWRRLLLPPDMTWLLRLCKTEEMGVNASQLVNAEPLQNWKSNSSQEDVIVW